MILCKNAFLHMWWLTTYITVARTISQKNFTVSKYSSFIPFSPQMFREKTSYKFIEKLRYYYQITIICYRKAEF